MWAILQSMKRLKFISRRNKQSCKVVDAEQAYSDFSKSYVQHSDEKKTVKIILRQPQSLTVVPIWISCI